MSDRDDFSNLHNAAVSVQDALAELVERLEAVLQESEPEPKPVPDAERFLAEVPAEPPGRLPESLHTRLEVRNNAIRDTQANEAALRGEIASVRALLVSETARLDATIKAQPNAIMLRLGTLMVVLMVVLTGIILAALRYWPPGHGG